MTERSSEYVELHAHSYYSLLDGTSSPDALVQRAAELGLSALALTDHDALYGAVEFQAAAQGLGIKPVFGAELTFIDSTHLTLLVENEVGWRNLSTLVTRARQKARKGEAALDPTALAGHTEGLIALSGCRHSAMSKALLEQDTLAAEHALTQLVEYFGKGQVYVELQHHLHRSDPSLIRQSATLAKRLAIPYVATNNVHYATPAGHRLSDVLLCIRENLPLERARRQRRTNSEYYLKSPLEMARLFHDLPDALTNSIAIADRCTYTLPTGLQAMPTFPIPEGYTAESYLQELCETTRLRAYAHPSSEVSTLLAYELGVIGRAGLANYFLVVWDVIAYCQKQGILAQGRGSACNSLVAYLLGISPIDPVVHHLTFERFLSDERNVTPDIDIDIQADRRDEVIQYVYEKWGRDHVAMACTFIRYGARSALRDMAKVFEIPEKMLKPIAKMLDGRGLESLLLSPEAKTLAAQGHAWQLLLELVPDLANLPRHLGLHNGGMVVSNTPLCEQVPLEPATYPNRTVVQWDKEMLEESGIVKLDLLGLRMLSLLAEGSCWIEVQEGIPFDWTSLTFDDPAVYDLIARGDTIGCFQVESRAQAQMLPRLKPSCFNDLIIAISLIRPGPLQGDMVHPFLRRRSGEEAVVYLHPALESVLGETLGVVLWQEQVLEVTHALTEMSRGQAERLRRLLSKTSPELERLSRLFWQGAKARGVSADITQIVWDQLKAFGGYAFPKSHAAAFAVLVYRSAWLKVYHPAAFYAALLNNQPMGFWSPAVIVGDAKRHGVAVLPVDVNYSETLCKAIGTTLRLGFNYIKGMGEGMVRRIVEARERGRFTNLADMCRRTQLPRHYIEALISAGALDGFASRRSLLWELGTIEYDEARFPLQYETASVELLPLSDIEAHFWEQEITGVTTGPHILLYYRKGLDAQGVKSSATLATCRNGVTVQTAGQIVMHQAPPTARGVHFVTLEDEEGLVNLVIQAEVYQRVKPVIRGNSIIQVIGQLQRRGAVVSVLVHQVEVLGVVG